ncbi:hypothetical protein Hanom_Chr00s000001g01594301 [Helianthus anomalus]
MNLYRWFHVPNRKAAKQPKQPYKSQTYQNDRLTSFWVVLSILRFMNIPNTNWIIQNPLSGNCTLTVLTCHDSLSRSLKLLFNGFLCYQVSA